MSYDTKVSDTCGQKKKTQELNWTYGYKSRHLCTFPPYLILKFFVKMIILYLLFALYLKMFNFMKLY